VSHGFVRAADGTITTFDAPGDAGGTRAHGINAHGDIVGTFGEADQSSHGYRRAANGTIKTTEPKNSVQSAAAGINDNGLITGSFVDSNGFTHGFLRTP
jgi:uncharacterized membrane protein